MFKIVYRYIISNKKSSLGVVIGIIISTMLMFSMIQISNSYMSSFKSFVNSGAPQDFYVIDLSYEELSAIHEKFGDMGEDAPDRYLSTIFVGNMYYDNSKASVVMGYEGDLEYFKKTSLLNGNYPASENEICVEESYLQLHPELNIGDEIILDITLTNDAEEEKKEDTDDNKPVEISRKFTVCGIIKDVADPGNFFYTGLKTAESIFAENNLNCSKSNAITVEAEEENWNDEKIVNAIEAIENIVVDDTVEGRRYFNSVQLIYNDEKIENYADKGSFERTALTVFLLSLIIAVCLTIFVYNSISLSFVRKINVFGTMRCIGLNNKQLIRFILTEQLLLVSIGTLLGMASGALLNLAIAEKIMAALFSTDAVMKVNQSITTYFVTYLLTILSACIACLKLILRIRKMNPINIRAFHASEKILSEHTGDFTSKNFLFHIALRNLKRNSAKSVIQTVTLVVSFLLCLVICNFFSVIGVNSVKGAVDFSDYSIQANIADIVNNQPFSEEDLEFLKSMDGIDKVYTEKCPTDYVWDKKDALLQILIYDDDLWQKFAEINDINYDSSQPFSVLVSETAQEDETFRIHSSESDNEFTVKPDVRLNSASTLNYVVFSQKNTLIVNEKLAESKGINDIGYCAFLVKTDSTLSELLDIPFSTEVYITNLHDGQSNAETQLLGMIVMAIYIVIATVVLSFMIISNTIKENMASKKAEYGVMRAIGLSLKNLWSVACHENFILTLIAVAVSVPLSLIVNAYLSLILFQEIKISVLAYLLVNLILIGLIELFAYCNIKTSTNDSIVEMIYER